MIKDTHEDYVNHLVVSYQWQEKMHELHHLATHPTHIVLDTLGTHGP